MLCEVFGELWMLRGLSRKPSIVEDIVFHSFLFLGTAPGPFQFAAEGFWVVSDSWTKKQKG